MSAIDQYIQLYEANRETIDTHSAVGLNRLRPDALEKLAGKHLPQRGDEGFEKTSVDDMFAPDYGLNITRINIPCDVASAFRCAVPNVSTLLGIVVNDSFIATDSLKKNLPAGVDVMSLAEAARLYPDVIDRYYGKAASLDSPGTALNTLFTQDGVFVRVADGVRLQRPVQIVNLFNSPVPMLGVRRVLVVAGKDSEVQLLMCDHSMTDDHSYLSSQVVEIFAGAGSHVDYYDIEESTALTSRYCQLYAVQDEGSNLLVNGMTLVNGTTRNEYRVTMTGEHCETLLAGLAIGSGNQHVDNCSDVVHGMPRCHSNQLFKYVLDDKSTGAFEGSIEVTPGARFTEAFQSNRNVLASPSARMHTKPQLLIYNDDVKCSHGATTGQLDKKALFYMQTRGIPEQEARTMLMQAFMVDVIDTVRVESLRDRLRHLVERRFAGDRMLCGDCSATCH